MLTLKEFNEQAKILQVKWNECIFNNNFENSSGNKNDIGWNWMKINNDTGYLSTKRFFSSNNNSNSNRDENNNNIFNDKEIIEDDDDESTLKPNNSNNNHNNNNNNNNNNKTIIIEYDIIYSKSYNVPVLYLNGCFLNQLITEPLSWEELWNLLPLSCYDKKQLSSTPYITQVEHPILGTPCYQLHPCETNNLMEQILLLKNKSKQIINNNDNSNNDNRNQGFNNDEIITDDEDIDINNNNNINNNINNTNNNNINNNINNNNINNYLLSWLTIISPMINIKIPLNLIKEYSK